MAQDQTVVDHLLAGRQALHDDVGQTEAEIARLQTEVQRLSTAIEQLDSVIAMINSGELPSLPTRTEAVAAPPVSVSTAASTAPAAPAAARAGAPAKRTATRTRKPGGQAPKSIRVHVLEMLAAEDRDWSLAEIIDRIHDAGIQAHDDAVRSITIKLMKDGRVERVGRGQYRLARRGSARATTTAAPATAPAAEVPAELETAAEPTPAETPVDDAAVDEAPVDEAAVDEAPVEDTSVVDDTAAAAADTAGDAVDTEAEPENVTPAQPEPAESTRAYTPPLNLGQPWN